MKVEQNINEIKFDIDKFISPTISILGTRNIFYFDSISIKIGCLRYPVDYWIRHYEEIGRANDYTEEQIEEYFQYIKLAQEQIKNYFWYVKLVQGLQNKIEERKK